tara:strand:+ start:1120 stop:1719 length:600 start_codon:yes stop_codon:yes gene_type:complete
MKLLTRLKSAHRKLSQGESLFTVPQSKSHWDKQYSTGKWDYLLEGQPNISIMANMINKAARHSSRIKVLDVGCGNGALFHELNLSKIDYTGSDFSSVAIDALTGCDGRFINAPVDDVSQLDDDYDFIIFSEILYYGDYREWLNKYRNRLSKRGVIVVSMYKTWRTTLIANWISKTYRIQESFIVKSCLRRVAWNIYVIR